MSVAFTKISWSVYFIYIYIFNFTYPSFVQIKLSKFLELKTVISDDSVTFYQNFIKYLKNVLTFTFSYLVQMKWSKFPELKTVISWLFNNLFFNFGWRSDPPLSKGTAFNCFMLFLVYYVMFLLLSEELYFDCFPRLIKSCFWNIIFRLIFRTFKDILKLPN